MKQPEYNPWADANSKQVRQFTKETAPARNKLLTELLDLFATGRDDEVQQHLQSELEKICGAAGQSISSNERLAQAKAARDRLKIEGELQVAKQKVEHSKSAFDSHYYNSKIDILESKLKALQQ